MTPEKASSSDSRATIIRLNHDITSLVQHTSELASSNLTLNLELTQRKAVEKALKTSENRYTKLLAGSDRLQEHLRRLSRQVLSAQEDERKRISRELHDVIAQILTGITVRLAALKKEAGSSTEGLIRSIGQTQKLVAKSVEIIHQFARELRPAVLDDLGLIPALHDLLKQFTTRTGIRSQMNASIGVEQMHITKRTVFFRVAQEALANVERHSHANRVRISIRHLDDALTMTIHDDGRSFLIDKVMKTRSSRQRLGLLGMRERLDMVGGQLAIESASGKGTSIIARLPFSKVDKPTNQVGKA